MSGSTVDSLVRMANQIAGFFVTQPGETAALHTADHINAYWVAGMRRDLIAHVEAGGSGLVPVAADAVKILKRPPGVIARALQRAGEDSPGHQAGDDAG